MKTTYLHTDYLQSIDILRKTRDTRNTFTTIASQVDAYIQPADGGLRYGDMQFLGQNLYFGSLNTINTSIAQGDIVRRSAGNDLSILRIDVLGDHQELTLSEITRIG